ncbi:MAG: cell wall hydrolase [Rhodospirillales bacterium]|nr:cell wall hydrolase [Rhodospirillales bacterium]
MEAVAAVVMNRVRRPGWWGHDVVSVCRAPWQFSCWNAGGANHAAMLAVTGADPAFVTALLVAQEAIGGRLADRTGGADSYYAEGSPMPRWAAGRTPTAVIGGQIFFRTEA